MRHIFPSLATAFFWLALASVSARRGSPTPPKSPTAGLPPVDIRFPRTCLATAFPWLAFATVVAALATPPQPAWAGDAPDRSPVLRAVRGVHAHRIWCAPGMEADPDHGLSLYAHVEATGFRWQTLRVEVRLRTPEGRPLEVAKAEREDYADKKGRFLMSTGFPIFDDHFEWEELRASIPYEKLFGPPPEGPRRVIATMRVSAGGTSSVAEAEITVPPSRPPGVERAVRILAIDLFADATAPKKGADRGLAVEGYVGAVGLDRAKVLGRLSIRRAVARPSAANDGERKAKPMVQSTAESEALSDQARMLEHFVGYRALRLPPGRHRLVFRYSAQSRGLFATTEEEHVIEIPADDDAG